MPRINKPYEEYSPRKQKQWGKKGLLHQEQMESNELLNYEQESLASTVIF